MSIVYGSIGPVAVAVADEVERDHPEVAGERGDVAHERLEMAPGAVHQNERRSVARLEHPGAHPRRP